LNDYSTISVDEIASTVATEIQVAAATGLTAVNRDEVDVDRRRIYMLGEIEDDTGGWFSKILHYLQAKDAEAPVELWINSPGGDVESMFAIHDLIQQSKCPIELHGFGEVSSAAVLLLACGTPGKRFVSENCCLMAHEFFGVGAAHTLGMRAAKDRRKWEDWITVRWQELMGRYAKGGKAHWRRVTEKGGEYWLLGGQEIVEAGVADMVVK
jgi:ATP-dependent Clp protease protease subunit